MSDACEEDVPELPELGMWMQDAAGVLPAAEAQVYLHSPSSEAKSLVSQHSQVSDALADDAEEVSDEDEEALGAQPCQQRRMSCRAGFINAGNTCYLAALCQGLCATDAVLALCAGHVSDDACTTEEGGGLTCGWCLLRSTESRGRTAGDVQDVLGWKAFFTRFRSDWRFFRNQQDPADLFDLLMEDAGRIGNGFAASVDACFGVAVREVIWSTPTCDCLGRRTTSADAHDRMLNLKAKVET